MLSVPNPALERTRGTASSLRSAFRRAPLSSFVGRQWGSAKWFQGKLGKWRLRRYFLPTLLALQLTLALGAGYTTYRFDAINLGVSQGDYGFWVRFGEPLFYAALLLWGIAVAVTGYSAAKCFSSRHRWRALTLVLFAVALTPVGYAGIISFLEQGWAHAV